jgi:uncharacterized membrane protein
VKWGRPADVAAHRSARRARSTGRQPEPGATGAEAAPPGVVERPERILTLTDGVVAIAMTLLVLDLNTIVYHGSSARELWHALGQEGGRFIAFFISFWVIAQFWLVHHRVFRRITRHEDSLATRNFWFLFGISLLPFTTALLGESKDNPLPVTLFSANLLLISVSLTWLSVRAQRVGVAMPQTGEREIMLARARSVTTATLFVLPGVLAWIIRPNSVEWLFLLLLFADVPGRLLAERLDRRGSH